MSNNHNSEDSEEELRSQLKQLIDQWLELKEEATRGKEAKKKAQPKAKTEKNIKGSLKMAEEKLIECMEQNNVPTCSVHRLGGKVLCVQKKTTNEPLTRDHWTHGIEEFLLKKQLPFTVADVLVFVEHERQPVTKTVLQILK